MDSPSPPPPLSPISPPSSPTPTSSQLFVSLPEQLEVSTGDQPKKAHLSRFLISLLHYGGVPSEFFLDLLSRALAEIETRVTDRNVAMKIVKSHSGLDDDELELRMLFGKIPLDEPYLQYRLAAMKGERYKGLQEEKIPISNTYFLRGTADPTGTLGPNQICVILGKGQLSGDVLVYKYPGLHTGDVRKLQAICLPEWEEIVGNSKYGIFFPTVGPCSLADAMADNNFSGEMYWVSQNPDCWLACMDRVLTRNLLGEEERKTIETKMEQLVNIYHNALHAAKTGKKVQVPNYLLVDRYPHFMDQNPKEKTYHSTSVLGEIYDKVESSKSEKLQLIEIRPLPFFTEGVLRSCEDKWDYHYNQYLREMSQVLIFVYDNSSNESGADLKDIRNKASQEVIDKYKEILYGGVTRLYSSMRPQNEIYEEARAIYKLAYEKACQKDVVSYCSFAWRVAGEALCQLYLEGTGSPVITLSWDLLRDGPENLF